MFNARTGSVVVVMRHFGIQQIRRGHEDCNVHVSGHIGWFERNEAVQRHEGLGRAIVRAFVQPLLGHHKALPKPQAVARRGRARDGRFLPIVLCHERRLRKAQKKARIWMYFWNMNLRLLVV